MGSIAEDHRTSTWGGGKRDEHLSPAFMTGEGKEGLIPRTSVDRPGKKKLPMYSEGECFDDHDMLEGK